MTSSIWCCWPLGEILRYKKEITSRGETNTGYKTTKEDYEVKKLKILGEVSKTNDEQHLVLLAAR